MKIGTIIIGLLGMVLSSCSNAAEKPLSTPGGPPICPHILVSTWPDDIETWATGAPWIKCLDITSCGYAKATGAKVFYRPWDHDSGPDGDTKIGGEKFGKEILERLKFLPKEMWPDAISFQNEMGGIDEKGAQCFMDMYDTLREGGYKGMIVYGSYGPGGPDMKEWAKPYVKAACLKADAIETHEYWDLTIKHYDTWLAHRHVRIMQDYPYLRNKPFFIGEYGSDGVNKGEDTEHRSGWRDRNKLTEDEYIKQNEIYRHGDKANSVVPCAENVMAVFLYHQGATQWEKWETRDTKLMPYMKSTWPPTVGYITGKVTDASGKPIEGAKVVLSPSNKSMDTDAKGVYWFFSMKPGAYTIKVDKAGAKPVSAKTTLKAGDILTKDITLK